MNRKNIAGIMMTLAVIVIFSGCSSSNKDAGFNPATGLHTTSNWASPTVHGAAAKSATTGFATCQECHGPDFKGGVTALSCFSCHGVNAPHAPAPWRDTTYTHTTTDPSNASVCALCHTNGANSSVQPSPAAPAGTAPGCFNNTLCHATPGHPTGWNAPTQHGVAAKAAPSATGGFSLCQSCHGPDFTGGAALTSCFTCHGVNAPHAPKPWLASTYTHTSTDPGNASVCALCHTNGANSSVQPSPPAPAGTAPGCFNNTLCHATQGHPTGWNVPTQHGAAAKAAPSATGGFSLCQSCHGSDFTGGAALTSCFTCHGVNAPHAPKPWLASTYTHTSTDPGNASVCALCHTNGANSSVQPSPAAPAGTAPGCFNNTLCHATPACGTCHGIPPNGTAFPNVAGNHAVHTGIANVACATCHLGAGSGTPNHQNGVVDVIFDTTYNAKSGAASFNATASTCSNVSCHGGQTTPNWLTGAIDVNTQCTSCHASGTTQYNSYNSGQHSTHVTDQHFACTVCHDTTKLATVHFNDLNTTAMTQAYQTLLSTLNYTGTGNGTYGTCTPACHSQRTW